MPKIFQVLFLMQRYHFKYFLNKNINKLEGEEVEDRRIRIGVIV
jgi:hypothetical protein